MVIGIEVGIERTAAPRKRENMREPSSYQVRHPYDQRWDVLGLPGAFDFTYLRKNEAERLARTAPEG